MKKTKSTAWPATLLFKLNAIAVALVLAFAFASCDSDEPKKEEEKKEVENQDPCDLLPNYAWNNSKDKDYVGELNDRNIKSMTFYFLPNGNALQRIIYLSGTPTETIRCLSYKGTKYDEYGYLRTFSLYLASGTQFCEFRYNYRNEYYISSESLPDLPNSYMYFDREQLTTNDVNCIETYSTMKVGDVKEIGGGSTQQPTTTIDSKILGTWEYDEDGDIYRLKFESNGYVTESTNADNFKETTKGKFTFDGKNLVIPEDTPFSNDWGTEYTVTFSGSYMTLTNSLTTAWGVNVRFKKKS